MDQKTIQDASSIDELSNSDVFEYPEGLDAQKCEDKAKKWNTEWEKESAEMVSNWQENYIIYKEFEKRAKKKVTTKVPEIWSQIQTRSFRC